MPNLNHPWDKLTIEEKLAHNLKYNHDHIEIAKYLGYPVCCVEAYCNLVDSHELTSEQKSIWKKPEWFLPCKAHAEKIAAHEISISELLHNRHPEIPPFGTLDHVEVKKIITKIKERENSETLKSNE